LVEKGPSHHEEKHRPGKKKGVIWNEGAGNDRLRTGTYSQDKKDILFAEGEL